MGRPATGERKYSIQHMWDVHHEIVRLLVTGMKHVEIAATLGVTEVMVSYTANSPIVKRQLELLRAARDLDSVDVARKIQEIALDAVEMMEKHVKSTTESISLKAAQDILDRAGFAPVKKISTENVHAHLTREDIEEIKKRARQYTTEADFELITNTDADTEEEK